MANDLSPAGLLYDLDILEWSEHQAHLLQQHAAGHPAETPDWTNVIEEIESVGRDQLRAVESHLVQALAHDLKCQAWPQSAEVPGWRAEARAFRDEAQARFAPSMRQRLDLAKIYRRALRTVPDSVDAHPPQPLPATCPTTLDQLLIE